MAPIMSDAFEEKLATITQLSVLPLSVSVFWSHPLSFFLQAANDKL